MIPDSLFCFWAGAGGSSSRTSFFLIVMASITTFAATNIDDLILLTALFASRVPTRRIVAGQYLGFAAIVCVSLLGIWATLSIPRQWIHALGLLPIAIALKQIVQRHKGKSGRDPMSSIGVISIAIVTFSNGADNIAVYLPFFVVSRTHLWLILSVYAVLVAMWCWVGRSFGNHPLVLQQVEQFGHWIIPLVLIALGIYVMRS